MSHVITTTMLLCFSKRQANSTCRQFHNQAFTVTLHSRKVGQEVFARCCFTRPFSRQYHKCRLNPSLVMEMWIRHHIIENTQTVEPLSSLSTRLAHAKLASRQQPIASEQWSGKVITTKHATGNAHHSLLYFSVPVQWWRNRGVT